MNDADPQLAFGSQRLNSMSLSHKLLVTLEGGQQSTSDGLYRNYVTLTRDKAMMLRRLDSQLKDTSKPAAKRKQN